MRQLTMALALTLIVSGSATGDTFSPTAIAPELGVETLTQEVARNQLDRDLFSNPYSSVVIANIDVYESFPFLESHYFQVVSDPGWNRILMGETGKGLYAFDGEGTEYGRLSEPRGLALSPDGRVYVSDTGNNRILVLETSSEFDRIDLTPVDVINGLSRPYDIAYSDGGTPEVSGDDRIYIAEAGQNRVSSYAVTDQGHRYLDAIGELGGGSGRFAGPMAVTVGRTDGVNNGNVYVADAHNRRIVHLVDGADGLTWRGSQGHDFNVVTSLDADHWGSLYVTGPERGVAKFSSALHPLAEIDMADQRPRSFHVVFANVHDHARGTTERAGQAKGIVLQSWTPSSGLGLMDLGVELKDLEVDADEGIVAQFLLTDGAGVTTEIVDPTNGTVVARRTDAALSPGPNTVTLAPEDFLAPLAQGSYLLRVSAKSKHADAPASTEAEVAFATAGGGFNYLTKPLLLGNSPNPFQAGTDIRFVVPEGPPQAATIRIFDLQGRMIHTLLQADIGPGLVNVGWDGRDSGGRPQSTGIYFYRVTVGTTEMVSKMMLIR